MLPISGWSRRVGAIFVAAGVAAALALWYFATQPPPIPQHPLRIGFEHNPPVQIRKDGGFAGLAVETVNEAARRAGVRLKWVDTGTSSDEAFQKGLVDLWPLMADLPDRRKRVHITRPWLHSSHALLLPAGSLSLDQGFTGRIALFKMPLHVRLLHKQFTRATLVEFPEPEEVVREVCRGAAAAGFLEGRVALIALREKPADCASVGLRVQMLPDLTLQHGVASTFEAAGAAETIRREIGNMFRDGSLAVTIAKYSYYGLDDTWASYDLMEAGERARRMAWGISALAVALTVLLWRSFFVRQRKVAEAALRESEERFRATFFQAAVGIAQTSVQGEWLLLNNRFSEIVGYKQAELRGTTFVDITHPDDREANIVARRQFLAGEISSWSVEKRYIHKNGATVWARVHVSLVRDQHHVPRYFISVIEDITGRIQAEHALYESEQRLTLAQSAARLGVWDWDLRTNVHAVSGEYLRLYGLPADHPSPTHEEWLRLVHPHDRKRVQAALQESIERTHVWNTEFRVAWPDGSIHWLLGKGSVFLDDSGQPVRIAGVNLDITERKQAEEVRSHLAAIVESSDDAIISKTLEGKIVSWNPGAERIYGYTAEEMLGLPISLLVPPDRSEEVPSILERLGHGERLEHFETTRVRKDGHRIEVSVTISPIRDSTGAVVGASVITRDITEQKRAEETLRRNLDEIAHLNRVAALGEMVTSLAHELNQPLAAILTNAEAASKFLNRKSPNLARVRECLTAIAADDERAAEVIKRLRALLKKDQSQVSLIDLNEVVSDALRLVNNDATLRETRVRIESRPKLPLVLGDRVQLCQVVLNLLVNGLQAAAEQPPTERWVLVRTVESDGGGVELTVEDSGKGIAEGDLARVFEPFFTTKREGLGMGLSISQSIVQANGGRIWAENREGHGAIFHCVLPVAQQATVAAAK